MPNPSTLNIPRVDVLGVGVHALDLKSAVAVVQQSVSAGHRGYVCVTGVHGIMEAQRNPDFLSTLNHALMVTPDGMPTVWIGRRQGFAEMDRVFGPDLMRQVCAESVVRGESHFLYGGNPGVAGELKANLERWFPGIRIVGTYTPPFRSLNSAEEHELVEQVAALRPDIFWVGLSTPKQERFMRQYIERLETKVMIGVGAAFDLHTGRMRDAPAWIKRFGLQWLHRLLQDPSRLWKRYLVNNTLFVWKLAWRFMTSRTRKDASLVQSR
ncbi:MAG: WecB/TagA/CpsF family glycosyltransferase [Candidatus Korobacteraceae bacterium]